MKIIIVGAGIGGLSTALALAKAGHTVTIFESASGLAEIGVGVQMTPNATKWFWKWGLGPDLLAHSALPEAFNIRQHHDGSLLRTIDFGGFEKSYGAPYIVIHRADVHKVLHAHVVRAGVGIRISSRVVDYDFEGGTITLQNGTTEAADLVIAMDGINSPARRQLLPTSGSGFRETGHAAYRLMAPVAELKADPQTHHLVSKHACNCWVGERHLVMTYMVKGAEWLNIVLSHPDNVDTSDWTPKRFQLEIQIAFDGWDPCVQGLLEHASANIQNWPVKQVETLEKWTSESGKFVLMGDAAHAFSFYLSMGVSMAVEDAAAICECLRLHEEEELPLRDAMKLFEKVRKTRTEAVRDASLHAGNILQSPPGSARDARDRAMLDDGVSARTAEGRVPFYLQGNSYGVADKAIRDWCYGYDAIQAIIEAHRGMYDEKHVKFKTAVQDHGSTAIGHSI